MEPLPATSTDEQIIAFIDGWAALLEREDYEAAFGRTDHIPEMKWTPSLFREVVKSYGDADPHQRVTLNGVPTDITQRKRVERWSITPDGRFGQVWYDLNIDGKVSDLTVTFELRMVGGGVTLHLNDIHVM
jgi:hypothetical protein